MLSGTASAEDVSAVRTIAATQMAEVSRHAETADPDALAEGTHAPAIDTLLARPVTQAQADVGVTHGVTGLPDGVTDGVTGTLLPRRPVLGP